MTLAVATSSLVSHSSQVGIHTGRILFDIGRGGAILAATTAISSLPNSNHPKSSDVVAGVRTGGAIEKVSPQGLALFNMAVAMSLHYLAYSLARPSTIALFTSSQTGFAGNHAAFPLAMAFISPTSILLLLTYGKILDRSGPRAALRKTTYLCSYTLMSSSAIVYSLSKRKIPLSLKIFGNIEIGVLQSLVGGLFIFRESYVQLLTSQYWSFISSITTPEDSAKWFSPISGLTSITSALAGLCVSSIVDNIGLCGCLGMAGLILIVSLVFTERAYNISDVHGFNPANEIEAKVSKKNSRNSEHTRKQQNIIKKASSLFARVKVLKALFLEILAGQGLATLLNVCFVTKLSLSFPVDSERAGWMGKFFALINIISCCLQFGVLPYIMPYLEPKFLWRFMPVAMVSLLSTLCFKNDPSLYLISGSLMLMKVMEFAIRRMLDEMVYVPLDFDSRFLGKEIISVFGYRFGKSCMSLGLSGLTRLLGNFGLQHLSWLTTGASCAWLAAAWNVSNQVPTRAEAEEMYKKKKGQSIKRNK